eukprot:6253946-Alexandrium_andersonii.AAC.1
MHYVESLLPAKQLLRCRAVTGAREGCLEAAVNSAVMCELRASERGRQPREHLAAAARDKVNLCRAARQFAKTGPR